MMNIHCTNCRRPYPDAGLPYLCPVCGGVFDFSEKLSLMSGSIDEDQPGIWRYQDTFILPEGAPVVTLGEGNTPLGWSEVDGKPVALKLEYLNPTGSFKDRGSAVLVSLLKAYQVESAVEDSSGNAGASLAAYCSRAGIQARIFVPDYAAGPKRAQIAAYGADVVRILGPRSNAGIAVRKAAEAGAVYASHAYMPFGMAGYATIAYELFGQLGEAPGTLVAPAGQGGLLLGIGRGFEALLQAGRIERLPRLIGVQARACAPLWSLFSFGPAGLGWVSEGETLTEGIRVKHPVRGDPLLQLVEKSQGAFFAVDEEDILPARDQLTRSGFYVEPTSAVVWPVLKMLKDESPDPIVAILTGSGYKFRG
jgi:threonine synthase